MKVMLQNKYEIEIHDQILERYKPYISLSLQDTIEHFLWSDFDYESVDQVFSNHTQKEISKVIHQCMIEEIYLHGNSDIFTYLDSIGYSDYEKPQL